MSVLVVGGDEVGHIKGVLHSLGAKKVLHWNARGRTAYKKKLPQNLDYVVMITNFLNHNSMLKFKKEAKKRDISLVYSKKNVSSIYQEFSKKLELDNKKGDKKLNSQDDLIKANGCTC